MMCGDGRRVEPRRGIALAIFFPIIWSIFVIAWQWDDLHYDFNALYFAGHFLAQGRPDLVYAVDLNTFPLPNHPEWFAQNDRWDCEHFCAYPFIYPPIWATLMAPLTSALDLFTLSNIALLVQIPLLSLCPLLAWRLWRPEMSLAQWTFRCLVLTTLCTPGTTSLVNNQPQLFITFLMLLAFERAAHGRPFLGGMALGLAATIKIFPVVFALIWLREGNWRAIAGATVLGAAILVLNFVIADPALNKSFIEQAGILSGGVFPSNRNYSLTSVLGWLDAAAADPRRPVVNAYARFVNLGLLLLGLALLIWRARRADAQWRRRFMLPAIAALLTVAGPLGWPYYLFLALFALQLLPEHFGRNGTALMVGLIALIFVPAQILLGPFTAAALGASGAVFAIGAFLALTLAPTAVSGRTSYVRPAT